MPDSRSDLLTSNEVLAALLARPALRRVAVTCVLPAVRVDGEWLYRRSDLDAWLEQQQREEVPCLRS